VKSHCEFNTAREMQYTSQHWCHKTIDGKIALYREWCFPNCKKSWWIKFLLQVLEGAIAMCYISLS